MRRSALSALGLLAVLAAPATAAGTPGPFVGAVRSGETRTHQYDNNPSGQPCPHVMAGYSVRLTYAPVTDTVTLSAFGVSVQGTNGGASLHASRSYCTSFGIAVTGTSVAGPAATYTVTVTRDLGSGGTLG